MSSSGLIYAVIVGAWAAYLVPMWLRRQDELNEARPTERFSTAIRLLSGRAGMERRYARDLRARSAEEGESSAVSPDAVTDSVDVRAFAVPPTRTQETELPLAQDRQERTTTPERVAGPARASDSARAPGAGRAAGSVPGPAAEPDAGSVPSRAGTARQTAGQAGGPDAGSHAAQAAGAAAGPETGQADRGAAPADGSADAPARKRVPAPRRAPGAEAAAARARRTRVLARRRRTTVVLFLAFTLGAIVAAVGGLAFLWAPAVPAVLLSAYIAYLRVQERRRFAYQMDRRRAEAAAQRLRESRRQPRRRAAAEEDADEPEAGPEPETDPGLSALAADRRALVEQTDHAEWLDQQRERRPRPGHGDSWDPVPVPLPTYVTAPVAPRATSDVDLGAPDTWSSARSSAAVPEQEPAAAEAAEPSPPDEDRADDDGRTDARRAASARRSRERGRTPLFDQYEDGDRPRAANE
ncbi:gephyrin-like molybdotransferase receptor GlpR [Streptomyces sp. 16-176A]|uniref:divisome protein SepX/GlpR n=1 Tax=Streptomyces sp. 16-176A TaxID=2530458 RepID=UPI00345CA167